MRVVTADPQRYAPCAICRGDGCAACDNAGFVAVVAAWLRPVRSAPAAVTMPRGGWRLAVCRDGTAATGDGADKWTFARWAVCLSVDGVKPAKRYRNGGPVGVLRPVTGKRPPEWMARCCAWAAAQGGVSEAEGAAAAEWYRVHRGGEFAGVEVPF